MVKTSVVCCLKLLLLLALGGLTMHVPDADVLAPLGLGALRLDGHLSYHDAASVARDFGNRCSMLPSAVLHPGSVSDVAAAVRRVFQLSERSPLTVAARGHGHSLLGQSQTAGGIVVKMESLGGSGGGGTKMRVVHAGHGDSRAAAPYVDAPGGELWINVLHETLKHGLAPRSWTDYLHLTVGGTLSNAGVSGQAFRHGPQISNVNQLEIVTGRGDIVTCSPEENSDLFYGALGGLGQFGIITRARIALERVLYSDFASFTEDQEALISAEKTFDYIEGFVTINRTGILNNWRTSFKPQDPVQASHFQSDGRVLYCLEFLDRVHSSEVKLRAQGLWEVPHPWLNLLIPRSAIHKFASEVFGKILKDSNNGPILLYPVNRSKWDNRTSVVIPDEEIFYLVGFLSSAPSLSGHGSVQHAVNLNNKIVGFCDEAGLGMKQYLAPYTTQQQWKAHFGGARWETFERRKHMYDPLAILAPGQRIFPKGSLPMSL